MIALDPICSLISLTLFGMAGVGLGIYVKTLFRWLNLLRELGFRCRAIWFPFRGFRGEGHFAGLGFKIIGKVQDSLANFRVVIVPSTNELDHIHFEPQNLKANLSMLVRTKGKSVGDPDFDSKVWVSENPHDLVTAVLDEDSRHTVGKLMENAHAGIQGGKLYIRFLFRKSIGARQEITERMGGYLRLLAQWVKVTDDVPSRFERNAIHDPLSRVRINNLFALDKISPTRAMRTAERLMEDPDVQVCLAAAALVGEKGMPIFFRGLSDPEVDPEIAVESVRRSLKGHRLTGKSFFEFAQTLLGAFSPEVRRLGAQLLKNLPPQESLVLMGGRALRETDTEVLLAFVDQLSATVSREGEDILLSCLQKKERDVRLAAARRLGEVGTFRSLEALDAFGRSFDVPLGMVARGSADLIRARVDTRQRGLLSVPDFQGQGGGLSLESGEGGSLSFNPKEESKDGEKGE